MRAIKTVVAGAAAQLLASCGADIVELQRVPSPSGEFFAVLERNGGAGAMDSYTYDVRVGSGDRQAYGAMIRHPIESPGKPLIFLEWRGETTLAVVFYQARRAELAGRAPKLNGKTIEILLEGNIRP